LGFEAHFCRIENDAGQGNPDVDGCLHGTMMSVELKSCDRPARPATPIRMRTNPKTRAAQSEWHRERAKAGCKHHFILIQVGEARDARLYLIPGDRYDTIEVPEAELEGMSLTAPACDVADVLMRASKGY
jgi:hypothetical protein